MVIALGCLSERLTGCWFAGKAAVLLTDCIANEFALALTLVVGSKTNSLSSGEDTRGNECDLPEVGVAGRD